MTWSNQPLRMYGQLSDSPQLEWSWVERQLTTAELYWVDVAGAGSRPHPRPVWAVWRADRLHLSIGTPAIRRAAQPGAGATVHIDGALDVVIIEGDIVGTTDSPDVINAYDSKYEWDYDVDQYGPLTTLAPGDILAWRADGPGGRGGFVSTGRFTWSPSTE